MEKLIAGVAIFAFIVVAWLGIMWGAWTLWCWVLPQVYATGAPGLLAPGFWLFVACWTLVSWIGNAVFGSRSTQK